MIPTEVELINIYKHGVAIAPELLIHAHMFLIIKHFIIQLMHNIQYVDTIKIINYLKVLQHVSDHRGSIIR